jgi:hypothetical protein
VRAKLAAPAINRLIMCFLSGFGLLQGNQAPRLGA